MWTLLNRTPYAVDRTWVRDKEGNHVWVVALKATFDLDNTGQLRLAAEQEPPLLAPVYTGEPGHSSTRSMTLRVASTSTVRSAFTQSRKEEIILSSS